MVKLPDKLHAICALIPRTCAAIAGLAVGLVFGYVGFWITGNRSILQYGPIAGIAAGILAYSASYGKKNRR